MDFFDKTSINAFSTNINSQLDGFTLNLYTLKELFPDPSKRITYIPKLMKKISDTCLGYIGQEYRSMLSSEFEKLNPNFEMVILTNQEIPDFSNPTNTFKQIGIPVAALIVEKEECKKYPNMYTVNLICSHSAKGKYMMALYCYICKLKGQSYGLLELAKGYLNPGGLCLYQKFGFKYDPLLYDNKVDFCFSDLHNLPMIVDFSEYDSPETSINILTDMETLFQKDPICMLRDKVSQTAYGILLNLQRFVKVGNFETNTILHSFNDTEGNNYKYHDLFTYLKTSNIDLQKLLEQFASAIASKVSPPINIISKIIEISYTPAAPRSVESSVGKKRSGSSNQLSTGSKMKTIDYNTRSKQTNYGGLKKTKNKKTNKSSNPHSRRRQMEKRKTCKKLCKKSYIQKHIHALKANGQNVPDKKTIKLIYNDCKKKMCNPGCKNTFYKNKNISFHPDYSLEDVLKLKRNGALSWCAQKPIGENSFDFMVN